jgi:gamma-glutamyltranspeptidase
MLNVAEALNLHARPRRDQSAQTFYEEMQILKAALASSSAPLMIHPSVSPTDLQAKIASLLSKDYGHEMAQIIRASPLEEPGEPFVHGSHQAVVIDADGNMLSVTHSMASSPWGDGGIFVGGIALNSASYRWRMAQRRLQSQGYDPETLLRPGDRLPEALSCYLVLHDGQPFFVAGAFSTGLLGCNFQNTVNVLAHGLSLEESIGTSRWGYIESSGQRERQLHERIGVEPFPETLLKEIEPLDNPFHQEIVLIKR